MPLSLMVPAAAPELTLPGSVCPTCTPTTVPAGPTWTGRGLAELVERLGGAIVGGSGQGAVHTLEMVRKLKEHGKLNLLKGVFFPEGPTDLARAGLTGADFDHVSFLVVNGDYGANGQGGIGPTRASNYTARDAINASPTHAVAPATVIDLDDPSFGGKFNGTTTWSMMGTNNLAVFDVTLNWLNQNVPNPMVATSCPSGKGQGNNGL